MTDSIAVEYLRYQIGQQQADAFEPRFARRWPCSTTSRRLKPTRSQNLVTALGAKRASGPPISDSRQP